MKPVLPFLLFFLFVAGFRGYAQNYACLLPGQKQYFINGNGYLRGMRIDSVKTSGDTTFYYPFHRPISSTYFAQAGNLDPNGGSWLGKHVMQLQDGTWLFDDMWGDTLTIKTQAQAGDSWVLLTDISGIYYQATITAVDTMTVMGVVDSVKKVSITAHNDTGVVYDSVNSLQLLLSKSHGFVQAFDLYCFPFHQPGASYSGNQGDMYVYISNHVGIYEPIPVGTNPAIFNQLSFLPLQVAQLTNYNVGDVLEISEDDYNVWQVPNTYNIDTIKSKNVSNGITAYTYNGWRGTLQANINSTQPYHYNYMPNDGQIIADTMLIMDTTMMPEETGNRFFYYYWPSDNNYCTTSPLYYKQNVEWNGTYTGPFQSQYEHFIYKTGLGLVVHDIENEGGGNYEYSLMYSNVDGVSCGQPMTLGVAEISKLNGVKVIPIPRAINYL